jgi:hypothetical protein
MANHSEQSAGRYMRFIPHEIALAGSAIKHPVNNPPAATGARCGWLRARRFAPGLRQIADHRYLPPPNRFP